MSNCLKHAFPNGRSGNIKVTMKREGSHELLISVEDDGVGMPPNLDLYKTNSLGVQLVLTLIEQVGAKLEIDRNQGTKFKIYIPLSQVVAA
jgi:two-component sensor histidine kinase